MKTFSAKKRKLYYTIHNPNTVEDTAKMLLDVLVQANEKKVEKKLQELADYDALIDQKADKYFVNEKSLRSMPEIFLVVHWFLRGIQINNYG